MIDITTLIAIVGALFTAAAWIVNKLDKITSELAAMRAEAKDFVTHEVCHRRRQECPCVESLAEIQKSLGQVPR